jgi:triosephosphate isomerase
MPTLPVHPSANHRYAIGNWKLHMTLQQTRAFFTTWNELMLPSKVEVGFAVPFTALSLAADLCQTRQVEGLHVGGEIGAQDCAPVEKGAYTGEVSAEMVREAGGSFVILGHSERRRLFGETDALIREKVACAEKQGLRIVLCCGETAEERREGLSLEVVQRQIEQALHGLQVRDLLIAYEPVWAIGSGQAATPQDVEAITTPLCHWMHHHLKIQAPVLYGGSVNPENAQALVQVPGISGVLVGGPSTDPLLFHRVVQSVAGLS